MKFFNLLTLLIFMILAVSSHQLSAQLSGSYLIDQNGSGDFNSLTAAIDALNDAGMSSEVRLQLQPGTYIEKVMLDSIVGNSLDNQIIIESLSGNREDVTISFTSNDNDTSNYVIRLNHTKGVVIRNITFNSTDATSSYGRVIELTGLTRNVIIEGNQFLGNRNSSAIVFGFAAGGGDYFTIGNDSIGNLTVKHNLFKLFSPAIDSEISYFAPEVFHENIVIEFNQFIDCDGINLANVRGLYYGNNLNKGEAFRVKPLAINSCKGDIIIEKNIAYPTLDGIKLTSIIASKENPVIVSNNFISGDEVLLQIAYSNNISIAHNTLIGTSERNSMMLLYSIDSINIFNNIFYQKSNRALFSYYELQLINADYNCYYAPNAILGYDVFDMDSIKTFEGLQTLFNGEEHGLYLDPNFISDTTYQSLAIGLIDAGIPLSYITDDIEGELRNDSKPDIGADESTLISNLTVHEILANPSIVNVDEGLTVTWRGENTGETTFANSWRDDVYLSRDTQLDEEDALLGFKINEVVLAPNESFEFTKSFLVDVEERGNYYVLVKLNADTSLYEDNSDNLLAGPMVTINFTNRPNLIVSDIELPAKINSGSVLYFDWTVTNNGDQPTTEKWTDYLYFSSDLAELSDHENFDPDQNFLAKVSSPVGLAPGETYTNSYQFKLPVRGSGLYYIKVIADAENTQKELDDSSEDNATISEPVSVEQTPLSDLVFSTFNFPEVAFSGEWMDFSYTVKNTGTAKTAYDLWTDYIYITTDSVPDGDTFRSHWQARKEIKNWKELEVGEEFVIQESIRLPYCEADTFYIYLLMDTNEEIIEISEDNNSIAGSHTLITVYKPSADFVVERIDLLAEEFETEQFVKVEYDIYNRGLDAASIFNDLQDALYLSEDQTLDSEEDIRLMAGLFLDTMQFAIDQKITRQQTIKLPDSLFGDFYIVVNTDDTDEFCEVPYEGNNAFFSEKINIKLAPAKDLVIQNLTLETSAVAGEKMTINYDLLNDGAGAIDDKKIIDSLFLVAENELPNKHNYVWIKERENFSLASKTSVQEELYFTIPIKRNPGNYRLMIRTDAADKVYEFEAEENNLIKSDIIKITRDDNKLPDLDIAKIILPEKILSGETINIELIIENLSQAKTNTDEWKYRIILLDDKSETETYAHYVHFGYLEGGSSITENYDFVIPDGLQGNFKLAIHADVNYKVFEYYKDNNADTIDITIELSPWADLIVNNFNYPDTLTAGQLTTLSWDVSNQGVGDTKANLIADRIYVSKDNKLDKEDLILHTMSFESGISSNAFINQTAEFRVNPELEGLYYLIVKTDVSNQEYEHTDEDNNVAASNEEVYIFKPKPIDLEPVVSTIDFSAGDRKVYYSAVNNGPNTGYGSWTDAAFLSADAIWDKDDILMGYHTYSVGGTGLAPNEVYQASIYNSASFVKPDYYYVIIKTDVFNYIPEVNLGNNNRASESAIYIDMIEELIPGVVKDSIYRDGRTREHYYKLNTSMDKGYLLTMDGKNSNNSTELFYKIEDLPQRGGNFDYKGANDFQEVQQIIVPSKDEITTDYILAYGDFIFGGESMDYTLFAEEKEFSIISITPEFGGTDGIVVMDINGFDFSDSLRATLRNSEGSVEAVHSISISSTKARAHFNLNSIDPGIYDVILERLDRDDETNFPQSFEVQDTSFTDYYMTVTGPDRVRVGRDFIGQINFSNNGNINDYDVFILIAFYMNNHKPEDFSIDYLGDGISDELPEELQALHPFSNETLISDDRAYYFYTWLPVFAAQSSGQFSFKFHSDLIDTLNISAQFFANPISEIHFTGDLDDLKKTRFLQDLDNIFSNGNTGSSNARVMGECIDDPEVVEAMIWKGVRAHAEYVGVGIPGNKTQVVAKLLKEGLKSLIDPEAHDRAEGVVQDLIDERRDIVLDPTKKSAYDHLIKNLDNCLTPDLKDQISKCLVGNRRDRGNRTYETVYTNKCTKRPPKGRSPNVLDKAVNWVKSLDPNEIIGTEGVGEPRYVTTNEVLGYRINFENVEEATAAAQRVTIDNELRPEFEERSFRLNEVGWNDTTIQLPNAAYFSGKFDLGEKYNNYQLQLTAGLDAVSRKAFWRFQTIDPATGAPPTDPDGGFLPPNDSTGIGEGYVSYTIKSKSDLVGGTEVNNEAVIVFDQEKSLNTNIWTNTIQGDEGIDSYVNELSEEMFDTRFVVSWQQNEAFNSFQPDIRDYTIYVSKDDESYEIWQLNTLETEAFFTGERGSYYQFFSIARTFSGESESAPTLADAETRISEEAQVTGFGDEDILSRLKNQHLVIYPNPSEGELNIAYKTNDNEDIYLSITTISGKKVFHEILKEKASGIHFKRFPDLSKLKSGLYIIKIEGVHFTETKKWIKY